MKSEKVFSLPHCDLCGAEAKYEGRTVLGEWAYMCETCFPLFGLGLGEAEGRFLLSCPKCGGEDFIKRNETNLVCWRCGLAFVLEESTKRWSP